MLEDTISPELTAILAGPLRVTPTDVDDYSEISHLVVLAGKVILGFPHQMGPKGECLWVRVPQCQPRVACHWDVLPRNSPKCRSGDVSGVRRASRNATRVGGMSLGPACMPRNPPVGEGVGVHPPLTLCWRSLRGCCANSSACGIRSFHRRCCRVTLPARVRGARPLAARQGRTITCQRHSTCPPDFTHINTGSLEGLCSQNCL